MEWEALVSHTQSLWVAAGIIEKDIGRMSVLCVRIFVSYRLILYQNEHIIYSREQEWDHVEHYMCSLLLLKTLHIFSANICTKAARHALMTEQLNKTGFYYHNVEAEPIIWVRIRVHQQQWAFTSSKTTAFKADWIGPWDDGHIFYKKKKDAANWVCPSVSLHVNHCAPGKLRTSWVPSLQVLFSLIASCHIIHFH